jgi:hypothetical protein
MRILQLSPLGPLSDAWFSFKGQCSESSSAEVIGLCSVALEVIDAGLLGEWFQQRGSGQQVTRLRERAGGAMEGDVSGRITLFGSLILVFWLSVWTEWENIRDRFWITDNDTTGS